MRPKPNSPFDKFVDHPLDKFVEWAYSGGKRENQVILGAYKNHNLFREDEQAFRKQDPHLSALSKLKYRHPADWWRKLSLETPGIYILTGGRQIGKSTSCKLLIDHCLKDRKLNSKQILYLPCDEIYDAKELAKVIRYFLEDTDGQQFLLIIDEITFVKNWERAIKSLADEGFFRQGICLLTGSDTLILKEAAMSFPGRRGKADVTDFHLHPLSFMEYVNLRAPKFTEGNEQLFSYFQDYLICGGYLRAINDLAETGTIAPSTLSTYEQWIRCDFLKRGKSEENLLQILRALLTIGVSPISYSSLTHKLGLLSKDTCIDYIRLLKRMDILLSLQAFDTQKLQGFPRKDRKFHFVDPFITHTVTLWLKREGYLNSLNLENSTLVEACVASHCRRYAKTFYLKGQGEVDVVLVKVRKTIPIEVKWSKSLRSSDVKMLKHHKNSLILGKAPHEGEIEGIPTMPVYLYLYQGLD